MIFCANAGITIMWWIPVTSVSRVNLKIVHGPSILQVLVMRRKELLKVLIKWLLQVLMLMEVLIK
jgi:hypothetical protein